MKTNQAYRGSGKTRFNRGKAKGDSWLNARDAAINKGTFKLPQDRTKPSILREKSPELIDQLVDTISQVTDAG